jgi:transposase, IS5 family
MQMSFASAGFAHKKRVTRREKFLAEMERVVRWTWLVALAEPAYPSAGLLVGRQPIGAERMLRMYFLQLWFGLADEALEDAIYDSHAMREFVGIDLARENVPDATTVLKFRRLLEQQQLTKQLFKGINAHLAERGLLLRDGPDGRRHHHRRTPVDREQGQGTRPRDAPDQERQRMALRHESAHRR